MKKLILILLACCVPAFANADAGLSSDNGRSIENSQSGTISRDKSLSADKSRGRRETLSDSRERAFEESKSRSHQERIGNSYEKSQSSSIDININGLLLREFTKHYERDSYGTGTAWDYFHTCRPITRAVPDYPVFSLSTGEVAGLNYVMEHPSATGLLYREGFKYITNPRDRYISRYAQCRMTASYWLSEAGNRASRQQVVSESEMRDRIREVFVEMDADESLFQKLRQRARDSWQDANCSDWLRDWKGYSSPEIDCGVFTFHGQTFTVDNRETLSESSIDGRVYKITLNASESESVTADDNLTDEARVSYAERESNSREKFKEQKKTASLNKSKTLDRSNSSKVDRSAGSSMNASPKD